MASNIHVTSGIRIYRLVPKGSNIPFDITLQKFSRLICIFIQEKWNRKQLWHKYTIIHTYIHTHTHICLCVCEYMCLHVSTYAKLVIIYIKQCRYTLLKMKIMSAYIRVCRLCMWWKELFFFTCVCRLKREILSNEVPIRRGIDPWVGSLI